MDDIGATDSVLLRDVRLQELLNSKPKLMLPMLCMPVADAQLDFYMTSRDWGASPKLDGDRVLVNNLCLARSRTGAPRPLPAGSYARLRSVVGRLGSLDGELTGTVYNIFDCRIDPPRVTLKRRYSLLGEIPENEFVKTVPIYTEPNDKQALMAFILSHNMEGIVFKKMDSLYQPGRRSPDWRKWKRVSTVDAVVTEVRPEGKESLAVGLWNGEQAVEVAKVKVPPEVWGTARIDDIVEVRFLVFTEAQRLREPIFLRVRRDKTPSECGFDQIPSLQINGDAV